jgi:glycosyltransferase involved in cell wall biosynthesis
MNSLPKITLVMPSYNQAAFLETAICSVLEQHYSNLEFMIMDGGSVLNLL